MAVAAPPKTTHPVALYAEAVIDGRIAAGKLVRLACERHLRDLEHGHERGLWFDETAADRAIEFFRFLRHSKGEWAGRTFELAPWQIFIVGCLFGWKRADGTRRFRASYIEVPRKNGKTTLLAGICLLLAFFDDEPGAEVYAAATKRDQAKICWGEARQMVLKTPALRQRIQALVGNLHDERTRSKFEPLGADADSMDGLNIHGAGVDELHAHKTRAIVDVLETATGARRQPLINYITTAGSDKLSVCRQQHDYGDRIVHQVIDDDTFFVYVATLDEGDDWTDERVWAKANPNLGISVKIDDLRRKCRKAREVPSEQNAFKRLHLDVWTEQVTKWVDVEVWDEAPPQTRLDDLEGRACYGGLDLANVSDLAAFALWFPDEDGEGGDLFGWFWVPEEGIRQRAERDRVPYDVWETQGLISATEGNVTDYDVIKQAILDLGERFEIRELGYDPWNATQLATQLQNEGLTVVPVRQGLASLAGPTREYKKLVVGRKVRHGGNPVLRWMFKNIAVRTDPAGNERPDKEKSSEKIDGQVAAIMAVGRAATHAGEGTSVYEERGLLVIGRGEDDDDDEDEE